MTNLLEIPIANKKQKALEKAKNDLHFDSNSNLQNISSFFSKKEKYKEIDISKITVSSQVRKTFNEDELEELAASIRKHGLLEPIVVFPENNNYHLVCGERRYRACLINNMHVIQARIIEAPKNQNELIALQIIENFQRKNLDCWEISEGIKQLADNGLSNQEIANLIGKQIRIVYARLSLFTLNDENIELSKKFNLSFKHNLKFVNLKNNKPEIYEALIKKLCKEKELLTEDKIIHELNKALKEKEKKTPIEENVVERSLKRKIRVLLNFEKIDKINANFSASYNEYFKQNPDKSPNDLVVEALDFYFKDHLNEEKKG